MLFSYPMEGKTFIEASCTIIIQTGEKVATFKGLSVISFQTEYFSIPWSVGFSFGFQKKEKTK